MDKIESVKKFPTPQKVKEEQSFLGFYRKFIKKKFTNSQTSTRPQKGLKIQLKEGTRDGIPEAEGEAHNSASITSL